MLQAERVTFKLDADFKQDIKMLAKSRRTTVSGLLKSLVVKELQEALNKGEL